MIEIFFNALSFFAGAGFATWFWLYVAGAGK